VEGGAAACCWASEAVLLPYTCELAGSARRKALHSAFNSLRNSVFSCRAWRAYSDWARKLSRSL